MNTELEAQERLAALVQEQRQVAGWLQEQPQNYQQQVQQQVQQPAQQYQQPAPQPAPRLPDPVLRNGPLPTRGLVRIE